MPFSDGVPLDASGSVFGVYVHIPFCRTRCPYCDFVSNAIPGAVPKEFSRALREEILRFSGPDFANTIFFGGGTPSLLSPEMLHDLISAIWERFTPRDPEISLEANPDDVTQELVSDWLSLGVNRISLGVQSFDDKTLRYLGRRHDAAKARNACEIVAASGVNWGMDLIFGGRPVSSWDPTLRACAEYSPKHVSAYGLTYEPKTLFAGLISHEVDDDTWLSLYRRPCELLHEHIRYEISNFAKPGFECRHNLIYWRNGEYVGFGPAAYSFISNTRSRNLSTLKDYLSAPGVKEESLALSEREIRVETVIQHLRLREGLPKALYRARFGCDVHDDFSVELEGLIKRGFVSETADYVLPTIAGFELNNEIGLALVD
jgi:oxygen-independent coproporphyrinogen-3 oxidase